MDLDGARLHTTSQSLVPCVLVVLRPEVITVVIIFLRFHPSCATALGWRNEIVALVGLTVDSRAFVDRVSDHVWPDIHKSWLDIQQERICNLKTQFYVCTCCNCWFSLVSYMCMYCSSWSIDTVVRNICFSTCIRILEHKGPQISWAKSSLKQMYPRHSVPAEQVESLDSHLIYFLTVWFFKPKITALLTKYMYYVLLVK